MVCLTQCYQSVTTHLLLWPVEKKETDKYITGWHESEWFKGHRRVFMCLLCLIKPTISVSIYGGKNIFLSESWPVGEKWNDDRLTLWLCKPSALKANIPLLSLIFFVVVALQQETLKWLVWCNRVQVLENIYITKCPFWTSMNYGVSVRKHVSVPSLLPLALWEEVKKKKTTAHTHLQFVMAYLKATILVKMGWGKL